MANKQSFSIAASIETGQWRAKIGEIKPEVYGIYNNNAHSIDDDRIRSPKRLREPRQSIKDHTMPSPYNL